MKHTSKILNIKFDTQRHIYFLEILLESRKTKLYCHNNISSVQIRTAIIILYNFYTIDLIIMQNNYTCTKYI